MIYIARDVGIREAMTLPDFVGIEKRMGRSRNRNRQYISIGFLISTFETAAPSVVEIDNLLLIPPSYFWTYRPL